MDRFEPPVLSDGKGRRHSTSTKRLERMESPELPLISGRGKVDSDSASPIKGRGVAVGT